MHLLVSVRSAEEVEPAFAGGANIIDAKEPFNGSLGAVSAATLAQIASRVNPVQDLSVALGDVTSVSQVIDLFEGLKLPSRTAPTYLKLGFAGVKSRGVLCELMGAAVEAARNCEPALTVVAVAYADAERAAALPAETIVKSAADAGAGGVLIDTHIKDGTRLLDWWSSDTLKSWVTLAHSFGLMTGVAGSIRPEDIAAVAAVHPDVIGFRGAACDVGRLGRVTRERVAILRQCIDTAVGTLFGPSSYIAEPWRNA
jgi:uncharacterized protein (UPF0264 family)